MKSLKFLLSAFVACGLLSCQDSSDGPDNTVKEKVYLSVNISVPTSKADVEPVSEGYTSVIGENSYVYVIDGIGKVVGSPYKFEPEDGTSKMTFETTNEAQTVLFLANVPAGFAASGYSTREALEKYAFGMNAVAPVIGDDEDPNGVKYAFMYNYAEPQIDKNDPEEWKVAVKIAPLFTRFEISEIAGDAELTEDEKKAGYKGIAHFKLAGIYMNNIYRSMTLAGGFDLMKESVISRTGSDWSCDIFGDQDSHILFNAENGAWAYHLAPSEGVVPQIILELKDVTLLSDKNLETLFITVNSFEDENGNAVEKFERGNVYQIEKISFNEPDLSTVIDPDKIQLTVTVSVKGWVINTLTPVI